MKYVRKQLARTPRGGRRLGWEMLEQRHVLSAAAPWYNDAVPLDVNNDSIVSPQDAMNVINRLILQGIGPLGAPPNTPDYYVDANADNMLSPIDAMKVINGLIRSSTVVLDTLMPFTIDLTPRLEVSVEGGENVADGTAVHIDLDKNNNGKFEPDEIDYQISSMYQNRAEFALGPALPANDASGPYGINLRARVQNTAGVMIPSGVSPLVVDTQTSNALYNYVNEPDPSYGWSLQGQSVGPGGAYRYYVLKMTSQTWKSGLVNDPVWDHWLKIVVPQGVTVPDTALLLITGGSNTSGLPTTPDAAMVASSLATHAITAELRVVPNEPVSFFAEQPPRQRSEDEIIAYTYDQYLDHIGEPGNESWPLLLPMVKSAVRAMDTVQSFIPQITENALHVSDFVVTGYSKRGWTTWLTAAADSRVKAMIPGVFDNPNQGASMVHHYQVYGAFSEQVGDYSEMQIFERLMTPEAQELSKIVDPYRYLNNGRFEIPKLILNSAGDEFFVSDSSQYYFEDLPGDKNYMRYFPNTGHGLDASAVNSTATFLDAYINDRPLPEFDWTVETDGSIHLHTVDTPTQVLVWQATNPTIRDFRHGYHPEIIWTSSVLASSGGGNYVASLPTPATGATAFFIEMTFPSGLAGTPYIFTTDIRVNSFLPQTDWPYPSTVPPITNTSSGFAQPLNAVAGVFLTLPNNENTFGPVPLFVLPGNSAEVTPPTAPASAVSEAADETAAAAPGSGPLGVAIDDPAELLADDDGESADDAVDAALADELELAL